MDRESLLALIREFKAGRTGEEELLSRLESLPYEDLGFAKVDHHRALRWGFPEVIFCQGKTAEQVRDIALKIVGHGANLLATRANPETYALLSQSLPDAKYDETARTISLVTRDIKRVKGKVMILTAGTSDLPVAREALETARMLGLDASLVTDIGVAGIHRLLDHREELARAAAAIVVAGMEGALPSVVAGLVACPVIAVPTSVGYGASFGGIAPLLGMLNSCVPGVAVQNIDNGFGAAFLAFRILAAAGKEHAE
ncbi:MAG TPA: nickel pincer cofactor biosynthesis protein LarB [Spirochaetota bacterium]|nr:nickel pincer cofactor biosynthesis protein LarB [Spirochaetota bacterium]